MEPFLFLSFIVGGFVLKADCQTLCPDKDRLIFPTDDIPEGCRHGNRRTNEPTTVLRPVDRPNFSPYSYPGVQYYPNIPSVAQRPTFRPELPQRQTNRPNVAQQPEFIPNVVNTKTSDEPKPSTFIRRSLNFDETSKALTNFSLNLMRKVVIQQQSNIIVSPYSVATLLAVLQQGATNVSLQQISSALQLNPQASAAAYRNHTQDILSRKTTNTLRSANNIFMANEFRINPEFRSVAQNDFNSEVTPTSFANSVQAANQINGWVASKTDNKIDKLVTPESISSNTQMVLVNAIYFKGLWAFPFRKGSTRPDTFFLSDGTSKTVPFMMTERTFRAGKDSQTDNTLVLLPFEREEYVLMIILPSKLSNAHDACGLLTVDLLQSYLNINLQLVSLKLPRFKVKADTNLTPVLKQLGVTNIFEQDSGLSKLGLNTPDATPQVSSAVHSAVLNIDEEGGSAAAASAFAVVALSNEPPSLVMKIDRPFLAILWDTNTKVPLFISVVEDPSL